jgi:hypothetical protein
LKDWCRRKYSWFAEKIVMTKTLAGLYVTLLLTLAPCIAAAMGEGAVGNKPLKDRRMPEGANAIIDRRDRVAWYEGEGPFQAEGRGGIKAINQILADFAKVDVKMKRVVVHDGAGQSSMIDAEEKTRRKKNSRIDWTFSVWPKGKWENARRHYLRRNLTPPEEADLPTQIDIFTANIRWADVVVPAGIEVLDERLESHGFTAEDGIVFEGHVKELTGGQPMVAAVRVETMKLVDEKWEYTTVGETTSNADGTWVLKNLPPKSARIVVEADGFVSRIVYLSLDDKPQWRSFQSDLALAVSVSGRVTDLQGMPLADVNVRLDDLVVEPNQEYQTASELLFKTDADGRFHFDRVPAGKASLLAHKSGQNSPGLRQQITLPANNLELQYLNPGSLRVIVDFTGKNRPEEYVVELEPYGGITVGKSSRTARINTKNIALFDNVPRGKYNVKGHPNPDSEQQVTEAITVELFRSEDIAEVTIKAK